MEKKETQTMITCTYSLFQRKVGSDLKNLPLKLFLSLVVFAFILIFMMVVTTTKLF